MLLEVLLLLFIAAMAFIFFGHLKDAGLAFVAGGVLLAIFGTFVALDGIDVVKQRVDTSNFTAPFVWGYNTTYNFSYFTPSNTSASTSFIYSDVSKDSNLPSQAWSTLWLAIALLGAGYVVVGAATMLSKPRENL